MGSSFRGLQRPPHSTVREGTCAFVSKGGRYRQSERKERERGRRLDEQNCVAAESFSRICSVVQTSPWIVFSRAPSSSRPFLPAEMPRASTSRASAAAASSSSPAREARSRRSVAAAASTSVRPRRQATNGRAYDNDDDDDEQQARSASEDIDEDVQEAEVQGEEPDPEQEDEAGPPVVADTRDTFYITIYALVRLIPPGRVTTYGTRLPISTLPMAFQSDCCPSYLLRDTHQVISRS